MKIMLDLSPRQIAEFGPAETVAYIRAQNMANPAPVKTGKRQDTRN